MIQLQIRPQKVISHHKHTHTQNKIKNRQSLMIPPKNTNLQGNFHHISFHSVFFPFPITICPFFPLALYSNKFVPPQISRFSIFTFLLVGLLLVCSVNSLGKSTSIRILNACSCWKHRTQRLQENVFPSGQVHFQQGVMRQLWCAQDFFIDHDKPLNKCIKNVLNGKKDKNQVANFRILTLII